MEESFGPRPFHEESPLMYIIHVFQWLTREQQDRESMSFNMSSIQQAMELLNPTELEYLYNLSGTNNTRQILDFINLTRHQHMTMGTLPSLQEFYEYRAREFLQLYVPPVILAIGTLGNILSLVVLRSKTMVGVSSYTYLASLAVTDTVVLYLGLLRIWLMVLSGHDYQAWSDWVCKVSMVFAFTASDLSVWLIIAVTVERYIVVCMPFRANTMCNVSRAKKVIGLLFGIILSINLHFMWTVKVKTVEETERRCMAHDQFTGLVEVAWPWVDAFIYSFLPFIIISALNVLISREVMGAQSKRIRMAPTESNIHNGGGGTYANSYHSEMQQQLQPQQHPHPHHQQHQQQHPPHHAPPRRHTTSGEGTRLTIMLLTVSFTFLLLTLPVNILLIFTYYWNSSQSVELSVEALKKYVRLQLIKAIIELLMYTNHSINFFLYCATGQKFRRQFLILLRRYTCFRRHSSSNGFRFQRSTRRTSGSYLGGNSEVTSSSRCGRRASSCVSFDMTDCAVRWDCSQNNGKYREESSPLKREKSEFPNNKSMMQFSSSSNDLNRCCGGGGSGCRGSGGGSVGGGGSVASDDGGVRNGVPRSQSNCHEHYGENGNRFKTTMRKVNVSMELMPVYGDSHNRRGHCCSSSTSPSEEEGEEKHSYSMLTFSSKKKKKSKTKKKTKQLQDPNRQFLKPYKFNSKNGHPQNTATCYGSENSILKSSNKTHCNNGGHHPSRTSPYSSSGKRSCKIHFCSSKRNNNNNACAMFVEDRCVSSNDSGQFKSCDAKKQHQQQHQQQHSTAVGLTTPRRKKGYQMASFSAKQLDTGCCV